MHCGCVQSAEDIEALVVDEDMPELERFAKLLERGRVVQRLSVMLNLPTLVADNGADACKPLLSLLVDLTPSIVRAAGHPDGSGLAVAVAQALGALLSAAEPLPVSILEGLLLPIAIKALEIAPLTPIDENATGAEWLHFLLLLLRTRRLPPATLERTVLPWALEHGSVSAPRQHRLLCTHVLGAIAEANPHPRWIEKHFLGPALAMCQDTELVVRCSMCEQLHRIAAAVGPELAGGAPLTELLELATDEHPEVRAAAFECGVAMLPTCSASRRNDFLEPAVRRTVGVCIHLLEGSADAATERLVLRVSSNLSALLEALSRCGHFAPPLLDDSGPGGISVYERLVVCLSMSQAVELRRACARALPAAAAALATSDETAIRLHACARALRDDDERDVRTELLAALPLVASSIGTRLASTHTLPLVLWALERAEPFSLVTLLSHLPDLIATLSAGVSDHARLTLGQQLLPLLLQLEAPLAESWRGTHAIIRSFGALTDCLEPQTLFSLVLPTLFQHLVAESAAPNRLEAVTVICMHVRVPWRARIFPTSPRQRDAPPPPLVHLRARAVAHA